MYKRKKKRLIRKLIKFAFFCFILFILLMSGVLAYFAKDLPNPAKMNDYQVVESTKIYDRTGKVIIYDIHGEEKRTVIPFEEIPQYLKDATLVAEDDNFYHHVGLDWRGIARAAWADLRGKEIAQGGSTITQQYIKNAYLGGPIAQRTFARKIKEAILSLLMEQKYSKDEILGFYLNQIPYGSNAYGVEAASQTFFDKPAKNLTLAEAAVIAALPKAPSYYSPFGSHLEGLRARQEYILNRMVSFGYINQEQAELAKNEELEFAAFESLKAHHFVTMIKEYLEDKYGRLYPDIDKAGLRVYTTLDWDLQQNAEEIVAKGAEANEKNYRAGNAALVAIDPKTGQTLALVGSKDYSEDQFNVATSPNRQPGSSFKPFAYAAAFKKGYSPETILFDLETNFGKFGPPGEEKDYIPQNYDGKFRGPVTMRQSLAQSLNMPSVKTLYLAGINETINLAQDMGITTLKDRKNFGLSLVLGGGEIKLIDETAAFGVFATEGVRHPLSLILKIKDGQGKVLEEYEDNPIKVLDEQICRQISDMLSDDEARAPVFGSHSKLYLPGIPAAVKTGTTQDYSDGWTIGYTPNLAVGVWAGNNDYSKKMKERSAGLYVATPIWNEFMIKAYREKTKKEKTEIIFGDSPAEEIENEFFLPKTPESFTAPAPSPATDKPMLNGKLTYGQKVKVDKISGKLATDLTPPELIEERTYNQSVHTLLYYIDKDNPLGDYPANPAQDQQFLNWEEAVNRWVQQQPYTESLQPPTEYDNVHIPQNLPFVRISSPSNSETIYLSGGNITIAAEAVANLGIKQLDFFINDQFVSTDSVAPYSITFNPRLYLNNSDWQTIKVRAFDKVLNRQETEIAVEIR